MSASLVSLCLKLWACFTTNLHMPSDRSGQNMRHVRKREREREGGEFWRMEGMMLFLLVPVALWVASLFQHVFEKGSL